MHTMIRSTPYMDDNSKQAVHLICIRAVVRCIPQLEIKGEDHPVHQLPHPAEQEFASLHLFCRV